MSFLLIYLNLKFENFFIVSFYISYQNFCFFFKGLDLIPEYVLLCFIIYSLISMFNEKEKFFNSRLFFCLILLFIMLCLIKIKLSVPLIIMVYIFSFIFQFLKLIKRHLDMLLWIASSYVSFLFISAIICSIFTIGYYMFITLKAKTMLEIKFFVFMIKASLAEPVTLLNLIELHHDIMFFLFWVVITIIYLTWDFHCNDTSYIFRFTKSITIDVLLNATLFSFCFIMYFFYMEIQLQAMPPRVQLNPVLINHITDSIATSTIEGSQLYNIDLRNHEHFHLWTRFLISNPDAVAPEFHSVRISDSVFRMRPSNLTPQARGSWLEFLTSQNVQNGGTFWDGSPLYNCNNSVKLYNVNTKYIHLGCVEKNFFIKDWDGSKPIYRDGFFHIGKVTKIPVPVGDLTLWNLDTDINRHAPSSLYQAHIDDLFWRNSLPDLRQNQNGNFSLAARISRLNLEPSIYLTRHRDAV